MKAKILHSTIFLFLMLITFNGYPQFIDGQDMLKRAEVNTENISVTSPGKVITATVHSPGLVGNILKDSPDRKVIIYVPPGYETTPYMHYPVTYLYMGWGANISEWFDMLKLNLILDNLINQGKINPFILVCPDNKNRYGGSWFTNSSLAGNWEDFNVVDVVNYIDNNYRTIPKPECRGLAGYSMGGHGAVKFALKYPEIFGFLYSISGALLDFEQMIMIDWRNRLVNSAKLTSLPSLSSQNILDFSMAIAFAPNKNALGYGDFPFDKNGNLVDSTWQTWLKHNPVAFIPDYLKKTNKLSGIVLEFGSVTKEYDIYRNNMTFSKILNENGIVHTLNQHDGDHLYSAYYRTGTHIFPYFGNKLHGTNVKLKCNECLSNTDTLVTEFDIAGTLYIVPFQTTLDANKIISEKIKSVDTKAFSEIKIPLSAYQEGIYKIVGISNEGYISSPVGFSVVNETPRATFVVTDLMTGQPIQNCLVKIKDESYQTDMEGKAHQQGCGEHSLNFIYDNYYTVDSTITIFTDTTIAITLVKDSWVKVVDSATGEPIADATVTQMGKATTTAFTGFARVQNLRNGTLIYRIFKSNYFTQVDTVLLNPGDTAVIYLTRRQAIVEFLVTDESGPVANQTIQFKGLTVTTNQEGVATFKNVPARTKYQFNLENTCYSTMLDSVYVETDTLLHVTLEPIAILPELSVLQMGGDSIDITGSMNGEVFLVPAGTPMLPDSIKANQIKAVSLIANISVMIHLDNLPTGENYWLVYLVESCQNISKWSPVVVSVHELNFDDFMIYPNPTRNEVTIETNIYIEYVELSTVSGAVIYSSKIEGTLHRIDLRSLISGIYLITLKSKNLTSVSKIIKL
jgi:S-formylglutathione hydrolase FrmB